VSGLCLLRVCKGFVITCTTSTVERSERQTGHELNGSQRPSGPGAAVRRMRIQIPLSVIQSTSARFPASSYPASHSNFGLEMLEPNVSATNPFLDLPI
jgi:hypothetical protein